MPVPQTFLEEFGARFEDEEGLEEVLQPIGVCGEGWYSLLLLPACLLGLLMVCLRRLVWLFRLLLCPPSCLHQLLWVSGLLLWLLQALLRLLLLSLAVAAPLPAPIPAPSSIPASPLCHCSRPADEESQHCVSHG